MRGESEPWRPLNASRCSASWHARRPTCRPSRGTTRGEPARTQRPAPEVPAPWAGKSSLSARAPPSGDASWRGRLRRGTDSTPLAHGSGARPEPTSADWTSRTIDGEGEAPRRGAASASCHAESVQPPHPSSSGRGPRATLTQNLGLRLTLNEYEAVRKLAASMRTSIGWVMREALRRLRADLTRHGRLSPVESQPPDESQLDRPPPAGPGR